MPYVLVEAKILSDGHHQQVPSPKVEQILIQVGDTDNGKI